MPASSAGDAASEEAPRPSPWFIYLALCADGTEYCGITSDPEKRMAMHNGKLPGGARYTRSRRPVVLECAVPMPDKSSALKAERSVKKLAKSRKLPFLRGLAPSSN